MKALHDFSVGGLVSRVWRSADEGLRRLQRSSAVHTHAELVFVRQWCVHRAPRPFDAWEFRVKGSKPAPDKQRVEGHFYRYIYKFDPSAGPTPSALQIIRNYQQAAAQIGGKVMFETPATAAIMVSRNGQETWVQVDPAANVGSYTLYIVEKQAMVQEIKANADALQNGLAQAGHVEVPGILFDFGKSDVKPESESALQEITKLLQANATLKLWVVGHTDSVGAVDANLKLSGARAAAVAAYLTQKMGVAPQRLASFGAGSYAPVASNATEDGRARNRRVELVAQP